MKVFIKTFSVLMIIMVLTSFSKIEEFNNSISFAEQNEVITIDENIKFERAIEDLGLLNNQKLKELEQLNPETKSVTSQPILSKRKPKSYKGDYRGSFYRTYELN